MEGFYFIKDRKAMRIAEIQEIEKTNFESIHLFKEGIFWRGYEKSAWRFVKKIKQYRVLKKYVKGVKQDIVYLGFPENILEEILEMAGNNGFLIEKTDTKISITKLPEDSGFEVWKSEIELMAVKEKSNGCIEDEIIRQI